jgi:hypothetical protein
MFSSFPKVSIRMRDIALETHFVGTFELAYKDSIVVDQDSECLIDELLEESLGLLLCIKSGHNRRQCRLTALTPVRWRILGYMIVDLL